MCGTTQKAQSHMQCACGTQLMCMESHGEQPHLSLQTENHLGKGGMQTHPLQPPGTSVLGTGCSCRPWTLERKLTDFTPMAVVSLTIFLN